MGQGGPRQSLASPSDPDGASAAPTVGQRSTAEHLLDGTSLPSPPEKSGSSSIQDLVNSRCSLVWPTMSFILNHEATMGDFVALDPIISHGLSNI